MKNKEKLRKISKVIAILACIIKICMRVAAICIVLAMLVIPSALNNLKVENHTIQLFDEKIEFTETEEGIEIRNGENKEVITSQADKEAIKTIIKYFEENNTQRLSVQLEIVFLFALAYVVLIDFAMQRLQKLFKNIQEQDTPFNEENTLDIRKTTYFFLASFIISIAGSIVSSAMFNGSISMNVSIIEVIAILIGFSLTYIFEYGNSLEKKKTKKGE